MIRSVGSIRYSHLSGPTNRLLDLPVRLIMQRKPILAEILPSGKPQPRFGLRRQVKPTRWTVAGQGFETFPPGQGIIGQARKARWDSYWGKDKIDKLLAIAKNPSSEEIEDAKKIDGFFGIAVPTIPGVSGPFGGFSGGRGSLMPLMPGMAPTHAQAAANAGQSIISQCKAGEQFATGIHPGMVIRRKPGQSAAGQLICDKIPHVKNDFIWPSGISYAKSRFLGGPGSMWFFDGKDHPNKFHPVQAWLVGRKGWNISPDRKWGEVNGMVQNALNLEKAIYMYPFPSPGQQTAGIWMDLAKDNLVKFITTQKIHSPEDIEAFITIDFLNRFERTAVLTEKYFERRAKKKSRKLIIKAIAGAALGLMLTFIAPAIIATGFSAIMATMEDRKKRKMAVGLEKAAEQFAKTDAAFAGRIRNVIGYLGKIAEEAAAAAPPPTPIEVRAKEEPEEESLPIEQQAQIAVKQNEEVRAQEEATPPPVVPPPPPAEPEPEIQASTAPRVDLPTTRSEIPIFDSSLPASFQEPIETKPIANPLSEEEEKKETTGEKPGLSALETVALAGLGTLALGTVAVIILK